METASLGSYSAISYFQTWHVPIQISEIETIFLQNKFDLAFINQKPIYNQ